MTTDTKHGILVRLAAILVLLGVPLRVAGDDLRVSDRIEDVRGERVFEFVIDPSAPPMQFKVIGSQENFITSIEVFRKDAPAPTQILATHSEAPFRGAEYFFARDVNCDGFADLHLLAWWGNEGNDGYLVWGYDPESSRFVPDEKLSDLPGATIDCTTKEISTLMKGGMAGQLFESEVYKYAGDDLELIRRAHREYVNEKCAFRLVVEEKRGDHFVTVADELEKAEEWCIRDEGAAAPTASASSPTP